MSTVRDEAAFQHRAAARVAEAGRHTVVQHGDRVEIEGLSSDDAAEALRLLDAARSLQFEQGSSAAERFMRVMVEAELDLTPPASIEQARRLSDHRQQLLATPKYTMTMLGRLLGKNSDNATRTWVSRRRDRKQLFTVTVDRHVLIPAFQLREDGQPREELAPILAALLDGGVDGWSLWTWLTEGTPLLSGGVPERLAANEPERVVKAATRFAAQSRPAA